MIFLDYFSFMQMDLSFSCLSYLYGAIQLEFTIYSSFIVLEIAMVSELEIPNL